MRWARDLSRRLAECGLHGRLLPVVLPAAQEEPAMSFRRGSGRTRMTTHMLETADAEIAYDVRGPLPTVDGRPPCS
jgi:hypothetical protein